MTGAPVSFAVQPGAFESFVDRAVDLADDDAGGLLLHGLAVERDDDHRELAVVGQELALDDVVASSAVMMPS